MGDLPVSGLLMQIVTLDLWQRPHVVCDAVARHASKPRQSHYHNLIRLIASKLPLRPAHRIYFQKDLIGHVTEMTEKEESSSLSDCGALWHAPTPVTLADVVWLVYDEGEAGILLRAQAAPSRGMTRSASILAVTRSAARAKRQMVASSFSSLSSTSLSFGQSVCVNTSVPDAPLSIAMPDNCSQTPDVAAMRKISALEDELSKLREQIAMIVINQEHAGISLRPNATPPPPPPCGLPPPPPPPPPPMPSLLSTPRIPLSDIIKKNKDKVAAQNTTKANNRPDMAQVLKGLTSVKLRSIARSPGGTPIREKPRSDDPASLIAQALKKKFALSRMDCSPDHGKENAGSGFSPSPRQNKFSSRCTPPGPHLLKSSRAKLKRYKKSPFTVINV
ncbi:Mitochondrial fission regulator 2 [Lamellibrachia satsuma]|nr:Mitochondrial fission regulator 2 [Lamellibrachia satsuma]